MPAIEAADIVLMDDHPSKIAEAIRISKKTLRLVKENIVFALAVKVLCLALGAVGLAKHVGSGIRRCRRFRYRYFKRFPGARGENQIAIIELSYNNITF